MTFSFGKKPKVCDRGALGEGAEVCMILIRFAGLRASCSNLSFLGGFARKDIGIVRGIETTAIGRGFCLCYEKVLDELYHMT